MKVFVAVYMLVTLTAVFLRIDIWPISNFSVFRSPIKPTETVGYRWWVAAPGEPGEFYKFPYSKIHDSFSRSLEKLKHSHNPESLNEFAKNYIFAELNIAGRLKAGTQVRVFRSATIASDEPLTDARICLKQNNSGVYCVVDKEICEFTY